MVSREGTAQQLPTLALKTPVSLNGNCSHEWLGNGWHMLPDDIDCQPVL